MTSASPWVGWFGLGHADINEAPVVAVAAEETVAIGGFEATLSAGDGDCWAAADMGAAVTQTGAASTAAFGGRFCQVIAGSEVEDSDELLCFHAQGATDPTTNTNTDAASSLKDIAWPRIRPFESGVAPRASSLSARSIIGKRANTIGFIPV
ncbi:MAG: hypothetical protein ABFC77_07955 [Thermoguttaceae bacterium]